MGSDFRTWLEWMQRDLGHYNMPVVFVVCCGGPRAALPVQSRNLGDILDIGFTYLPDHKGHYHQEYNGK